MGVAQKQLGVVALASGLALMTVPAAAQSAPLFPAQVSQANIDCLFGVQCAITPHDETTDIPLPGITGTAVLQSPYHRGSGRQSCRGTDRVPVSRRSEERDDDGGFFLPPQSVDRVWAGRETALRA